MMDNMMLWNILLTMVATGFGWACNKMFQEVKRLQILLNKTREEYLPKKDFNSDFKEVLNYLRRLEDKLDRHMENNRG
tara:strand:- start:281 stop:514 length:234 start_codon:yes stop_codon:yes gene_type:complete